MKVNLACRDDGGPSLILSMHDFSGRPTDLSRRLLAMRDERASVLKVAYHARSIRDNLDLFDMLAERDRPTIALGMGQFGLMSRVLAPKFGGLLTFASLQDTSATAPGQPTIRELIDLYRFRSIGSATRIYGVVGWPVGHSLSPLVHNAGFDALGHDGVYLPMPVATGDPDSGINNRQSGTGKEPPARAGGAGGSPRVSDVSGEAGGYASLKATLLELIDHPRLDLAGLSVTIPHKRNLYRLADEQGWAIDPLTARIGAANTVTVQRDGSGCEVSITNTDAAAARSCLADVLGDLAGRHIVVIGAGGVARAIVVALVEAGVNVTVCNRTRARAEAMADELGAVAGELDLLGACDALVNCTPVGMAGGPSPDESPVSGVLLASRPVVFDTVYNPIATPLLKLAGEAGCETIDGVTMFVRQAAAQFAIWTSETPPMSLFDRIVRETLGEGG
jgi:3-dehydroquinate dehydratase/shikimate dehydrogenase